MNTVTISITSCHDCKECDHNGTLQSHPKYICNHIALCNKREENPNIPYWYEFPVIANMSYTNSINLPIPDWCPLLKENKD